MRCLRGKNERRRLRKLCIEGNIGLVLGRNIFIEKDRLYRTCRNTGPAVNALLWIYNEQVSGLVEAVYRAYLYTVGVLTAHARVGDNMWHA